MINLKLKASKSVRMKAGHHLRAYRSVGKCIYCGSARYSPHEDRVLGEEHIINEGVGGTLGIREASCQACEGYTSAFELRILNEMLWAPRFNLNVRMKGQKKKNSRFRATRIGAGDIEEIERMPLADHPTLLMFILLHLPGILLGRPKSASGVAGGWTRNLNLDTQKLRDRGFRGFASAEFDTVSFCQMLAKIAHSFAYAELGDRFTPALIDAIRTKHGRTGEAWSERYHFVGGNPAERPKSTALHELDLATTKQHTKRPLVVVRIRLFAKYGAPTYYVVAGYESD